MVIAFWFVPSAFAWDAIGPTWPEMPIEYYIASDLDGFDEAPTLSAIQAAFDTWNDVPCARVRFEYVGRTADTFGTRDGQNTVSLVGAGWPGDPARVSSEFLTIGGPDIVEADIGLNTQEHTWVLTGADGVETLDLQAGVTHEVGRLLGLWDSLDPEATQNPSLARNEEGRALGDDDVEGICTLYPVEDVTGGEVPLGGACVASADCADPYRCVADAGEQYCAPVCPRGLCPADFQCFEQAETPVCTKVGCGCNSGAGPGGLVFALAAWLGVRVRGPGGAGRSGSRSTTRGPGTTPARRR